MANALKCPNPSCPFLFDPTQVPPGAILTCPRCGMRFTLGPVAPPVQQPPPAFTGNEQTRSFDDGFKPPAPPDNSAPQQPSVEARVPRTRVHRPPERSQLVPLLGVLLVVATMVVVGVLVFNRLSVGGGGGPTGDLRFEERNVLYRLPVPNWEKDDDVKALFGANLVGLKHKDGSARVAIEARDFKTRDPQPGELREGITERLKPLFEDLDLQDQEGATWAGRPATKVTFRGNATTKLGEGTYLGEAYALGYKGVGYWFFAAAPESEVKHLSDDLDDLRQRMKLLDLRDDWKPTADGAKTLVGVDADYRLTDGDGWWKKLPDPKIEDPKADTAYDAEFKLNVKRDVKPKARVAVLLLEPTSDDPVATLRGYLREQYEKLYGLKEWQELTEPPLGDNPTSGELKGIDVARFKVTGSDPKTAKLVVIAAIKMDAQTGDGVKPTAVGVHAACSWDVQMFWEKRLVHLAGSLRGGR